MSRAEHEGRAWAEERAAAARAARRGQSMPVKVLPKRRRSVLSWAMAKVTPYGITVAVLGVMAVLAGVSLGKHLLVLAGWL